MNINFHYYVVKTLAHYANFGGSEANQQKLAYYSQFVDDYYTGKGYPETVYTTGPIPGLSYFQAIEKVVETKDGLLLFYPAFTGFSSTDAVHESVMKEILVPFHFITPKSANQLPVKSDDRTVYRCMAADRDTGLLINMIMEGFIKDIKDGQAGGQDEWIIKLGMLLHIYADTFAHEGYSGGMGTENWCSIQECHRVSSNSPVNITSWYSIFPIGHGEAMHAPDVLDFRYEAMRKDGNGNKYKEARNNKDRYEICAKRIYTMLCGISGTSPCTEQQWQGIFQRIWEASAEAVEGADETYNTSKLNQIWGRKFADDNIRYDYPQSNPYFGLDKMEVKEINLEALEKAGYSKEDVYEVGTAKGNHAREFATVVYHPTDEYFIWNKYAYMHRSAVKDGAAKQTAILIGVTESDIRTSDEIKESSSQFKCPENDQIIVGRYHKGDENGKTQYKYGKVRIVRHLPESSGLDIVGIRLSQTFYSKYMKESNSSFMEDNIVIVGREHKGDENGDTCYLYKRVFVESGSGMFLPCKTASAEYFETSSIKESAGKWAEFYVAVDEGEGKQTVYAAMYGREHHGDENGTTTNYFALFDIDQNAEALTEDEFNALQG